MRSSLPRRGDGVLAMRGVDCGDARYRSNSSLELVCGERGGGLRREYGSHGSIDVIGGASGVGEDYGPGCLPVNQSTRTPHFGRAAPLRVTRVDEFSSCERVDGPTAKAGSSPKLRLKFHKFWGNGHNLSKVPLDDGVLAMPVTESFSQLSVEAEERSKRRSFAHHDCQSLMANLGYAATVRRILLSRRRNTTTGASAASLLQSRASDIVGGSMGDSGADAGDGRSNDLLESCPFFRNEIGGEEERCVSLSWRTTRGKRGERAVAVAVGAGAGATASRHRPAASYGLSVLEFPPGQSHWRQPCPFTPPAHTLLPIESQDLGALYYRKYFYGQVPGRALNAILQCYFHHRKSALGRDASLRDALNSSRMFTNQFCRALYRTDHQNWFGMDEHLGPVAISIKKERVELPVTPADKALAALPGAGANLVWQYRLIIRTSELLTLRGSVLEDAISSIKPSNNSKHYNTKDVFEYVAPEIQLPCLRLGLSGSGAEEQLLRLDEQCVTRHYKVGVMYCTQGQATEEDMYNNKEAGSAFVEFLQSLGQTVRLKGFDKYKAGLDNKSDSTGTYSVYAQYRDCEVMFHVSTMLPYTPNNRQQLLRKRHIGNDIVTIVFQEPGAQPFTPKNIRSQFQHVFIIVRAINPCTENTHYSIAVSRSKEVPIFGPPIKEGAMYPKGEAFTDLLLSKVINGENAAIQSPKFSTMATRTRQEYLKDLAKNYITATPLDTGQKFSLFSSLLMKGGGQSASGAGGGRLAGLPGGAEAHAGGAMALAGGALCWLVAVQDEGSGGVSADCFLGVSSDTIVIIEEISRQIVLVIPTKLLLGWVVSGGGWTRVYYHRGECVCVRGGGEPLLRRLAAVAPPGAAQLSETILERNASGQLGFHVQPDGLVTAVEGGGTAARAGVRRGVRLLEVCRAAVVTLHHDQLVDLLKTSEPVTVTLTAAATPRCECSAGACEEEAPPPARANAQLPGRQRRTYDRSFSPPRSSDSSGYGTGGSGRSARRSPEMSLEAGAELASRRYSHDEPLRSDSANSPRRTTPKRTSIRPQSGVGSLQEELMRLIDPESIGASHVVTTARPAAVVSPPSPTPPLPPLPLPLPEATTLDWPALVHTATRAMLQICEEHQYPSMDNCADSTLSGEAPAPDTNSQDSWRDLQLAEPPTAQANVACECGLKSRVAALEANVAASTRARHDLEEEVRRLRRHNARLRDESARAVRQLRRFTQWFMHTVDRQ